MLAGVFIGGESRRLGGRPKALLVTREGETLLARTVRIAIEAGLGPVLVGNAAYLDDATRASMAARGVRVLDDAMTQRGPLGGLVALLREAGAEKAIAIACDMPRLDPHLLELLVRASPTAAIVAPRRNERWEPLCARYDASRVLAIAAERLRRGELALQGLLETPSIAAEPVTLDDPSVLDDVDSPEDAARLGLGGLS